MGWLKSNKKKVPEYLKCFKDFFKKEKNLDKIEYVFYAIFSIDLLILYPNTGDESSLIEVNLMINEAGNHKKEGLQLIKDRIKEDLNKIKINNNTILTVKEKDYKFKPINYYFSSAIKDMNSDTIINSITKKNICPITIASMKDLIVLMMKKNQRLSIIILKKYYLLK